MSKPVLNPSGSSRDLPPDHFEVLPPEGKGRGVQNQALSHLIAYLMDNVIKIPGMRRGIGINPILDLIPVLGDSAATVVQMFTIFEGARRGVPKIILARMGTNILLNGAVGMIPGVGEAFSWWYRPSSRNYQLLLKHAPQTGGSAVAPARTSSKDYLFVITLLAVLLVVMGFFIAVGFYVFVLAWHLLKQAFGIA